jgi:hypothetical protein
MEIKSMVIKGLLKVTPALIKKAFFRGRIYWYKFVLRKEFRLSFAGLVKLTSSDGRNLLVASKRVRHKYQLPGGVFWQFNSWADRQVLEQDEVMKKIPKQDMRFKVKPGKEKQIPKVIKKFLDGFDREVTPKREFFEELIETGILNKELFQDPTFYKSHVHEIDFELTKGIKGEFCSFYRFEVFEVVLSEAQQKFIDEIADNAPITSAYVFASKNELVKGLPDEEGVEIQFPEFVKAIV